MCPCITSIIINDDQEMQLFLIYLFLVWSTCFGLFLRSSSGVHKCTYSFFFLKMFLYCLNRLQLFIRLFTETIDPSIVLVLIIILKVAFGRRHIIMWGRECLDDRQVLLYKWAPPCTLGFLPPSTSQEVSVVSQCQPTMGLQPIKN
jgi:hypothetical protein